MLDLALPTTPLLAYLTVGVIAALDLFLPILPTGSLLIAGGALAARGDLSSIAVMAAGGVGAWAGDLGGYRLGRRIARGLADLRTAPPSATGRRDSPLRKWQARVLRPSVLTLIAARYLPAGRTIAAVTAGRRAYPWRRYALYALAAEALWAVPAVLLGLLGGHLIPTPVLAGAGLIFLAATVIIAVARRAPALRPAHPVEDDPSP
jgi:membrane protein DedA with SNARE-associated domain